jgi:hypothetical protein
VVSLPYWPPYCGAEGTDQAAGTVEVCNRDPHPLSERHANDESGFEWWGFQSYPRSTWVQTKEE